MRSSRMTTYIILAMVLGIAAGGLIHNSLPNPARPKLFAGYISIISEIFLRLIKMIIAPLVFSTLVVGIAHMGDTEAVGRIGGKAMGWFVGASLVSLLLGLILVNLLRPGDNLNLPLPERRRPTNLEAHLAHAEGIRRPPRAAARRRGDGDQRDPADRGLLDVLRRRAAPRWASGRKLCSTAIEELSHVMLQDHRLRHDAGAARGVRRDGRDRSPRRASASCVTYGKFVGEFYLGLAHACGCMLLAVGFLIFGPRILRLLALIREPFLLAFSHRQQRGGLSEDAGAAREVSGVSARSSASCCRWAIRSISTAR